MEKGSEDGGTVLASCSGVERGFVIDIALMSMGLNQRKVQQQASLSVMKMAMVDVKQQGQNIQEMLSTTRPAAVQHAAQPRLCGKIDIKG